MFSLPTLAEAVLVALAGIGPQLQDLVKAYPVVSVAVSFLTLMAAYLMKSPLQRKPDGPQ